MLKDFRFARVFSNEGNSTLKKQSFENVFKAMLLIVQTLLVN